jgi:hypothetical protein
MRRDRAAAESPQVRRRFPEGDGRSALKYHDTMPAELTCGHRVPVASPSTRPGTHQADRAEPVRASLGARVALSGPDAPG